jgi:hypothetical protein
MAITPLPPAPLVTDDTATFNTKAFAWVNAIDGFTTEANSTASQVNTDAGTATSQAGIATTKAGEASASADLAEDWATKTDGEVAGGEFSAKKYAQDSSDSADDAAASALEAAGLVENYQGALASDPSLNKDGGALEAGDWYVNTSTGFIRAYTGSEWVTSVNVTAGVSSINGETGDVTLEIPEAPQILTPTNVSPADESTDIGETPTLEGSPYYSLYGKTQKSSQWEISTDPAFATTVYDSGEVLGVGVTHAVPAGNLLVSTTYYWRVRYRDIDNTYSDYSTPTEFVTAAAFNNFIPTPTATPAIGAALEGGFYTGLIWNQVTQSSTSTAIGTGSKTFTVTDAVPLFYSGQAVEVRSRANPGTQRMKGTVTASSGTTLTVNVTSVDGSGTYTDWSIMAKYRVIVAPKSSGENSSIAYKNANTAAPSETGTLTEGRKATLAMVAADTSTVYPAAHYCNNLSIGSYTDWYLPARDELELIWRNLKPTTDNNYTTADRPTGATPNYQNLGSLGDTANAHGLNNNSDPQGAAYTSSVPARTSVAAFQTGGAEAMAYGSQIYWSSTEYNTTTAWYQFYNSSAPGDQNGFGKGNTLYVRAVRRSII